MNYAFRAILFLNLPTPVNSTIYKSLVVTVCWVAILAILLAILHRQPQAHLNKTYLSLKHSTSITKDFYTEKYLRAVQHETSMATDLCKVSNRQLLTEFTQLRNDSLFLYSLYLPFAKAQGDPIVKHHPKYALMVEAPLSITPAKSVTYFLIEKNNRMAFDSIAGLRYYIANFAN